MNDSHTATLGAEKALLIGQTEPVPAHHPSRYPALPGLIFLFVVLPLLLLPEMVRREAVARLEARINAPVSIGDVDLNLFTGRAQVFDLVVGVGLKSQAVLQMPMLDLTFSRRALLRGEFVIHRVQARQPALHLERIGPTRWNIDDILRGDAEWAGAARELVVGELEVQGGVVTVVDRTTTPVVKSVLPDLDLTLRPVPLMPGAQSGQVTGEGRLGKGRVRISGTLDLYPFQSALAITAAGVPAATFQGYARQLLGAAESLAGAIDGQLSVALAWKAEGYLALDMQGTVAGRGVALWLPGEKEPFLEAARFTAKLSRVKLMPSLDVEVPTVRLTGATIRLARNPDGAWSVRPLWKASRTRGQAGTWNAPGPSGTKAPLTIRHLEARASRIEFVDRRFTPAFTGVMADLNAEVRLNGAKNDRAELTLRGTLDGSTPIALTGWFTPAARPRTIALEGTIRDYELSRANPYVEKYVGYRLHRGRLSADTKVHYDAGNLDATNEIRIRQIKVGDRVGDEFQSEVGIPLKLAVALLEGLDGEIRLRVPVRGNLRQAEFGAKRVVWRSVRNAIFKTIALPFRALGRILTLGGKITAVQFKPVEFAPGSLKPESEGAARIERLLTFLRERPNVELEIRGQASRQETKALASKARRGRRTIDGDLRTLAGERARLIERTLVRRGIAQKRLFVLAEDPKTVRQEGSGRVEFRMLH